LQALVTGGTGFIGSHVVRALIDAGWAVRCLVRDTSPRQQLAGLDVTFVSGDLSDEATLREAARGCDGVFHTAALYALWSANPAEFRETNVEGTRRVLAAAHAEGVRRVVFTSSVACIGQAPPGGLANEDTVCAARDLCGEYEKTKKEAEDLALQAARDGQDVVVVNPATAIGPGDVRPTPTGKIIVDFLEGRMPFTLDTGLSFVDVRDVAQGHLLAFEKGQAGRRYILANRDGHLDLRSFLRLVGRAAGRRAPRFRLPYFVAYLAGAVSTFVANRLGHPPAVPLVGVKLARHRMYFDPSRAITELGLPQTPIETAVRDGVAWFREQR
jgi:dihydroflavonol-4-reductase